MIDRVPDGAKPAVDVTLMVYFPVVGGVIASLVRVVGFSVMVDTGTAAVIWAPALMVPVPPEQPVNMTTPCTSFVPVYLTVCRTPPLLRTCRVPEGRKLLREPVTTMVVAGRTVSALAVAVGVAVVIV